MKKFLLSLLALGTGTTALLMIFLMLAGLHQAIAQVNFSPATSYPLGNSYGVVGADVNNDGKVDLISAGYAGYSQALIVLTNNGNGGFVSNAVYFTHANPEMVVATDVNGDGKVDLVCACQSSGFVDVFTNNGNGGFATAGYYSVGLYSPWVIAADVNGDGWVDLITGNNSSLVILTNTGHGTFVLASSPGKSSTSVAAADVNGDGKIDIIEAIGSPSDQLLVLTNTGNGTFMPSTTNAIYSSWPGQIATAYLNGNGQLSVIVPDYNSGGGSTLEVLTNAGNSGFGSNATYTVGSGPRSVIAADLSGNGKVDVVSVGYFGTLTVLTNKGNGLLASNVTLDVVANYSFPVSVAAADLIGNGKLDLVSANSALRITNTLSVFFNNTVFPAPTNKPTLNVSSQGKALQFSWPSGSGGWSLQQSSDFTKTNWQFSGYNGYPVADNGTNKNFTFPFLGGNLFFRLMHP